MSQECKYNSVNYFECQVHYEPWKHICETGLQQRITFAESEAFLKGKKSGWDDCEKYYKERIEKERREAIIKFLDSMSPSYIDKLVNEAERKAFFSYLPGHPYFNRKLGSEIIEELRRRAGLDELGSPFKTLPAKVDDQISKRKCD